MADFIMMFKEWLEHNSFKMFQGTQLNEVDEKILEMFNSNLEIKEVNYMFDFSTEWKIDKYIYHFVAKKAKNNQWIIGFEKDRDVLFKKLDSNKYVGDIFTGVFESLKILIQKYDVDELVFSSDNSWLIKFYNGKQFQRYLQKHFRFDLVNNFERFNIQTWVYKKNWN